MKGLILVKPMASNWTPIAPVGRRLMNWRNRLANTNLESR